jgi:TPR repeat protein
MDWWAAQFVLGYMLANGADGFKKDLNEARRYVEMSASAGNDKAAEFLRAIQGDQK